MKVLHTSDWHIGRELYGRNRYDEVAAFLNWLIKTIEQNKINTLLIAGDIFDSTTPSNRSQELYYRFLCNVVSTSCHNVIITAGNHDSPSFINAPRDLLKYLNIHVIGNKCEKLEDEVIVLNNKDGIPELIVCAVPYLRDRDIRLVEEGESTIDKERKLITGIRNHYSEVIKLAHQIRQKIKIEIPIIAMGHLFIAGGQVIDGDGVRELYLNAHAHISPELLPKNVDYFALGHLHTPQKVDDLDIVRYSGSPLPIGFGEAYQKKSLTTVEFNSFKPNVQLIETPVFQKLECINGDWGKILTKIHELTHIDSNAWLEIIHEGNEIIDNIRERLNEAVSNTKLEILCVKNNRNIDTVLNQIDDNETLNNMESEEVFRECLLCNNIPENQWDDMINAYKEIISTLNEEDLMAE